MANGGLLLGCHYCESLFKSQSSRSHHHARYHPGKHRWMKGHRLSPDFECRYCHLGFGSPRSRWNHEQRCPSKPFKIKNNKSGFTHPKKLNFQKSKD